MTRDEKARWAVRELREHMKLTQVDFADRIGKSTPTVQRYENVRAPIAKELGLLLELVREANRPDLEAIFIDSALDALPVVVADGVRLLLQQKSGEQLPTEEHQEMIQPVQYGTNKNPVFSSKNRKAVDNTLTHGIKSTRGSDQDRWITILEEILNSGNFTAIDAIRSNLIAFQRLVQADSVSEGHGEGKAVADAESAGHGLDAAIAKAQQTSIRAGEDVRAIQAELSRLGASLKRRKKSA